MTIVHGQGIGEFAVRFCRCYHISGSTDGRTTRPEEPLQLVLDGLWPGTWTQPATAFTVSGLRDHQLLTLQSHISTYDYHHYLRRTTDNVCMEDVPVSSEGYRGHV